MSILLGKGLSITGFNYFQENNITDTHQTTDINTNVGSITTLQNKFPVQNNEQMNIAFSKIILPPSNNQNIILGDLSIGKVNDNVIENDTINYNKLNKTEIFSLLATDITANNIIETRLINDYIVDDTIDYNKLNKINNYMLIATDLNASNIIETKLTNNYIEDDSINYVKLNKTNNYMLLGTNSNATNIIETKINNNYINDTSISLSKINATNYGGVKFLRADNQWVDIITIFFNDQQTTTIYDTIADNDVIQKVQTNSNIINQQFYNMPLLKQIDLKYDFTNYAISFIVNSNENMKIASNNVIISSNKLKSLTTFDISNNDSGYITRYHFNTQNRSGLYITDNTLQLSKINYGTNNNYKIVRVNSTTTGLEYSLLDNNMITDNTIHGNKITDNTIFNIKIADNTIFGNKLYGTIIITVMNIDNASSKGFSKISVNHLSATGIRYSTKYLRSDNTFSTIASSGGADLNALTIQFNNKKNWISSGTISTKTNIQIYGVNSNGMIIENNEFESCGIYFYDDACTVFTSGDFNSFQNWQDEDVQNSRIAYVNAYGNFIVVSSNLRKFSVIDKKNNDVLNRFIKLKVRSYGYKYDIDLNNDYK